MEKIGTDIESILLVDDNPTNLQVLFQTLDGVGCKLLVAKSGEIALSIAGKARPDLILLDIMMPGIDGYEV
jgi:CheY-like chemotaxis protein